MIFIDPTLTSFVLDLPGRSGTLCRLTHWHNGASDVFRDGVDRFSHSSQLRAPTAGDLLPFRGHNAMRDGFENILLIKMSSMGDILHALPAACACAISFRKAGFHG